MNTQGDGGIVTGISKPTADMTNKQSTFSRLLWKVLRTRQLFLIIMIAAMIIGLASISASFLSYRNIMALASNEAIKGFVLIGVLLLLVTGEFDLSVGAGMALVGVCMAWVSARTDLAVGIVVGIGVGLVIGILNGFLVTKLKMASFIATLGVMNMARSLCNVITQGKAIPLNNPPIVAFFNTYILGLPITFIMLIIFVVFMAIVLAKHKYFRKLFYTGVNDRGAMMVGINTNNMRWMMFIFSGAMIAIGGFFYTSMLSSAVPLGFSGLEMSMIAMCVIGGASLKGGQGSVIGCVLGLVLITLVGNAMTVIGISPQWAGAILGVILLIASILDVTLQEKGS
jgi:ribose transport system permease protein